MPHALEQEDVPPDEAVDDEEDLEEAEDEAGGDGEHVEASWQPGDQPRAPVGSDNGGQFTTGDGGSGSSKPAPKKQTTKKPAPRGKSGGGQQRRKTPAGQLGFDGVSGTGYGGKPDDRVKSLQTELNRLLHGKLRVDGEFGPLTTGDVKEAQRRLGMNATGTVDPSFIARLKSLKSLPKPKGKVKAAALADIELVRPGTWQLASGEQTFTLDDLESAARYAAKHAGRRNALKLGHVDPRFDGEPAFGWLSNADVYLTEDESGPVLKAKQLDGMPDWLAAAAPDAWPNRSVEGWVNYVDEDGETFPFVVDGLALLGVTPPGIGSIRSLRDLPAALGIAASAAAQRVVARAPTAAPVAATAPAPEAEEPIKKGAGMDPAKIREACGLPADASDDEVKSVLAAANLVPAAPESVAASSKDAPGTIRIDASTWEHQQDRLKRLEAAEQRHRNNERDLIITEAIKAGKFTPARREHWVRAWDHDPEGIRQIIASLTPGLVPVEAMGYNDADDKDFDAEFGHLFPPAPKEASRG